MIFIATDSGDNISRSLKKKYANIFFYNFKKKLNPFLYGIVSSSMKISLNVACYHPKNISYFSILLQKQH